MVCWADSARCLFAFFCFFALLNRFLLSYKWGVDIFRSIRSDAGAGKLDPDDVADHLFKGQTVLFVHCQQKRREHDRQHSEQRPGVADGLPGQKVGRNADSSSKAKADKLALGEVERDFCLDLGKVVRDIHIGHGSHSFLHFGTICPKVRDSRLHLVAPHIPAGRSLPCEQLHAGQIAHEGNDLITGFVRLFAVGFDGRNDKLVDVGGLPLGVSLGRQQADLGVRPCPEAQPIKPTVRLAVFLQPDKRHGFIGEAPRTDEPQSLRELGKGRPHEKDAVLGRKLGHRQRTQFINAHGGIVIFRRALHFLSRVAPRGICVNDRVFFDSYSPFPPPAIASRACSMRWVAMV